MSRQITCVVDRVYDPTDFHVYLHPTRLQTLEISEGTYVRIKSAARKDVVACVRAAPITAPISHIKMNRGFCLNLNVFLGQDVVVEPFSKCVPADRIVVSPIEDTVIGISGNFSDILTDVSVDFRSLAVQPDFILPIYTLNRVVEFKIVSCSPSNSVIVGKREVLVCLNQKVQRKEGVRFDSVCYDDLGGIPSQLRNLRFLIELPLLQSNVLDTFGVPLSRGVLITAPDGCGKSFIGKAIENETCVHFARIRGCDLLRMPAEEASHILRKLADRAITKAPSIVFIDDLDSVLVDQRMSHNERDVDKRLGYAITAVIDKLLAKKNVVVIATAKDVTQVPANLRNVNRLAHQIDIPRPDYEKRVEILRVMTRSMVISDETIEAFAQKKDVTSGAGLRLMIDNEIMAKLRDALKDHLPSTEALTVDKIRSMELGDSKSKRTMEAEKQNSMFSAPTSSFGPLGEATIVDPFSAARAERQEENPFAARTTAENAEFPRRVLDPFTDNPNVRTMMPSMQGAAVQRPKKTNTIDPFAPRAKK